MFNTIVCNILEIIFGIWLISVLIDFLFDIDLISIIRAYINKLTDNTGKN